MPRKAKPTPLTLAEIRHELDDIYASIPRMVRETINDPDLRAKMAEAYARVLKGDRQE